MNADVIRATLDRVARDQRVPTTMQATVLEVVQNPDEQAIPLARVHVDGNPGDMVNTVPVAVGSHLIEGQRVLVHFDPPAGAYIIGTTTTAPVEATAWCATYGPVDPTTETDGRVVTLPTFTPPEGTVLAVDVNVEIVCPTAGDYVLEFGLFDVGTGHQAGYWQFAFPVALLSTSGSPVFRQTWQCIVPSSPSQGDSPWAVNATVGGASEVPYLTTTIRVLAVVGEACCTWSGGE